jgi:hypothetical protein
MALWRQGHSRNRNSFFLPRLIGVWLFATPLFPRSINLNCRSEVDLHRTLYVRLFCPPLQTRSQN